MPARKTSNHLKELKGTARADRKRGELDAPPAENHAPPDWLIGPEAVNEWNDKVKLLSAAGMLTEAGLGMLGHYCNMHASAVKKWRASMAPTAAELTQLRLMAADLGFTPAGGSGGGGGKKGKKDADPWSDLSKGKRQA